jgi:hypothetical protein
VLQSPDIYLIVTIALLTKIIAFGLISGKIYKRIGSNKNGKNLFHDYATDLLDLFTILFFTIDSKVKYRMFLKN